MRIILTMLPRVQCKCQALRGAERGSDSEGAGRAWEELGLTEILPHSRDFCFLGGYEGLSGELKVTGGVLLGEIEMALRLSDGAGRAMGTAR